MALDTVYDILKVKNDQGLWITIPALKGKRGNGIDSVVFSQDGTLTITDDDGTVTTYTGVKSALVSIGGVEQEVETAEAARVQAENGRVGAEASRVNAETLRQNAETTRQSNESERLNAESARSAAEGNRASAESTRQENEATRTGNENTRQSNEASRASAETARASAESGRVTAENGRVTAENGRVSAENGRVTAEQSRVALYNHVAAMTADAETLAAGSSATATLQTDQSGDINLHLGIPQGDPGEVPAASIAGTEASATASAAHAAGEYFWLSGNLYIATADIAAGDTITAGTNCALAKLGDDVSGLANSRVSTFQATPDDAHVPTEKLVKDSLDANKAEALNGCITENINGGTVTFEDGADGVPVKSLVVKITLGQSGSGDPSPTNIRPISGWTKSIVRTAGKNLCSGIELANQIKRVLPNSVIDTTNEVVWFAANSAVDPVNKDFFGASYKENTMYTVFITYSKQSSTASNMKIWYTDGTSTIIPALDYATAKETKVIVTSANKTIRNIGKSASSGTTGVYYNESGLFEGVLTADDFVAYEGGVYEIAFPEEAGTVYGGTLDVTTGLLKVDYDWAIAQENGKLKDSGGNTLSATGYRSGGYVIYNLGENGSVVDETNVCNMYKSGAIGADKSCKVYNSTSSARLVFTDTSIDGWSSATTNQELASAWTAYVAAQYALGNILFVTWRRPEPIAMYQLNKTEIKTLLGLNNIWEYISYIAKDTVDLEYRADPNLYSAEQNELMSSMIAPIENGDTASQAYAQGEYFIRNNQFCKALAAISSGGAFTLGTNYSFTTVAAELFAALS